MLCLVVYGRKFDPNSRELVEELRRRGHEVIACRASDLSSSVSPSGSRFWYLRRDVSHAGLCMLRTIGPGTCEQATRRISLFEHMEFSGVAVVNPAYAWRRARDKYATAYWLAKEGIPVPFTFTSEQPYVARDLLPEGKFVYKPILGSRGYGSILLEDREIAFNVFRAMEKAGVPIYAQSFLEGGEHARLFVVGERVVASMARIPPPGGWKSNVAQGGTAVAKEYPELEDWAVKAVGCLGLEYAGVDFVIREDGFYVNEVNASPGWQALKRATGINVASEVVEHALNLARK